MCDTWSILDLHWNFRSDIDQKMKMASLIPILIIIVSPAITHFLGDAGAKPEKWWKLSP